MQVGGASQENPGSALPVVLEASNGAVSSGQSVRLQPGLPVVSIVQEAHGSQQHAPAAGLQPLSERNLSAAGKDVQQGKLLRAAALPKRCQALRSVPAVWADARYPRAGTRSATQGEARSRRLCSLHTLQETHISQLSPGDAFGQFFFFLSGNISAAEHTVNIWHP